MDPPKNNADYRTKEYWDMRYETEDSYDWFSDYTAYKHLLYSDVEPSHSVLMLGCGNSLLSEQMYHDGYRNITNTDFSPVVIQNMAEKHKDLGEMTWLVMDMTKLSFEPNSYDIILEKGTIDSLTVHEKDPWNLSQESLDLIDATLERVSAVLKPGGKFISIAFAQPHFRTPSYARSKFKWDLRTEIFGDCFHFFYYVMEKGKTLSEKDRLNEIQRENRKLEKPVEDLSPIYHIPEDTEDFIFRIEVDV